MMLQSTILRFFQMINYIHKNNTYLLTQSKQTTCFIIIKNEKFHLDIILSFTLSSIYNILNLAKSLFSNQSNKKKIKFSYFLAIKSQKFYVVKKISFFLCAC